MTLGTFDIIWSKFDTTGDEVMFQPDSFAVAHDMRGARDVDSASGGFELEVHSKRYVKTFLQWVCVEDLDADRMLAGFDLDRNDTSKKALSKAVRDTIIAEANQARAVLGAKLLRFYVADEPTRSCFAALGYLGDSVLTHGIVTEFEGNWTEDQTQFIAQTRPEVYWRLTGGVANGGCAYRDSGLDNGFTNTLSDSSHAYDSAAPYFYSPTKRIAADNFGFGYLPHDSAGVFSSKHAVAMDSTYSLDHVYQTGRSPLSWDNSAPPYPYGTDKSWDMFDYRRGGQCNSLAWEIRYAAGAAHALVDGAATHPSDR